MARWNDNKFQFLIVLQKAINKYQSILGILSKEINQKFGLIHRHHKKYCLFQKANDMQENLQLNEENSISIALYYIMCCVNYSKKQRFFFCYISLLAAYDDVKTQIKNIYQNKKYRSHNCGELYTISTSHSSYKYYIYIYISSSSSYIYNH